MSDQPDQSGDEGDRALMRAVEISQPGGPDVLRSVERPVPYAYEGEILIKVAAAGVNRPDILQRTGLYAPPDGASDLPGLEVAGIVEAVGRNTPRWQVGDRVVALAHGGGYAHYCVVHGSHALPLPDGLDMEQAAGLPETVFTVWHNVMQRGGLVSGETILIHGGASGIGTTAVQLCKARGATVIATAGTDEKCAAIGALGADLAINYLTQDYVERVRSATNGKGADVILDMVGGDYIDRNYAAAAMDGRIVQIALINGAVAEADFGKLMVKRLTHTGSTLRPRSVAFKAALRADVEAEVWPMIAAGSFRPVIDRVFALNDAADAHRYLEAGGHVGKIILRVTG
ncbi:MAG: NAD(P)H-quinone oxidoreductase [Alphaproteobacteria bacterium]